MRWPLALALQAVLMSGAALLYFGVRGLTEGKEAEAVANAEQILRFEAYLLIDIEQTLQDWLLDHHALVMVANWVYIWGHWPVIITAFIWLFARHRDDYLLLRNAMFVSGAIGLVIFVSYPVAPPRLLADFVDTVTEQSNAYRVLQPPGLVNKYAAMPSLHFGWNLLVGLVVYRVASTRLAEFYAIAGPISMGAAVVLTANHFVIDAIVGGMVAMVGYAGALWIAAMSRRSRMERATNVVTPDADDQDSALPPAQRRSPTMEPTTDGKPHITEQGDNVAAGDRN